jgi:hypothetical protein
VTIVCGSSALNTRRRNLTRWTLNLRFLFPPSKLVQLCTPSGAIGVPVTHDHRSNLSWLAAGRPYCVRVDAPCGCPCRLERSAAGHRHRVTALLSRISDFPTFRTLVSPPPHPSLGAADYRPGACKIGESLDSSRGTARIRNGEKFRQSRHDGRNVDFSGPACGVEPPYTRAFRAFPRRFSEIGDSLAERSGFEPSRPLISAHASWLSRAFSFFARR